MKRNYVLELLANYKPDDYNESDMVKCTIEFIYRYDECFERSLSIGHLTASVWIIDPTKSYTLLIHHFKLDKWLQPGGHCDGDPDVLGVAKKETFEETGLNITPLYEGIFDIDIHEIPQKGEIPLHLHYDIRFLFEAQMTEDMLSLNSEIKDIRWVPIGNVIDLNHSEAILRMVRKTEMLSGVTL